MNKIAVAVVTNDGRVLMLRGSVKEGDLQWRFPGGTVEKGESEEEAAVREVAEETGIKCVSVKKLGERIHPTTKELVSYHLCEFVSGEALLREPEKFDKVAWLTSDEIFECVTSDIYAPVKDYIGTELDTTKKRVRTYKRGGGI